MFRKSESSGEGLYASRQGAHVESLTLVIFGKLPNFLLRQAERHAASCRSLALSIFSSLSSFNATRPPPAYIERYVTNICLALVSAMARVVAHSQLEPGQVLTHEKKTHEMGAGIRECENHISKTCE